MTLTPTLSDDQKLYEGKAKIIFNDPSAENQLIQYFKDDATAFNNQKHEIKTSKGVLNNIISSHIMEYLGEKGIRHHFIERLNSREQRIKKADIIPVEVVVRNYAAGSFVKRYGIESKTKFPLPLIEFCYKSDEHEDPLISREHAIILGWANEIEMSYIAGEALNINQLLSDKFAKIGITLADFKIEFGRHTDENGKQHLLLADEISPDSCRLWDSETNEIMDKDRFRQSLGGLVEGYKKVATRLGLEAQMDAALAEDAANNQPTQQAS